MSECMRNLPAVETGHQRITAANSLPRPRRISRREKPFLALRGYRPFMFTIEPVFYNLSSLNRQTQLLSKYVTSFVYSYLY
mgnify:CR=1 FL=1